jgi:hypothetical protein
MAFTDHPQNKGFPEDLSQDFTLWNVVVQMAQSYETALRCYTSTLDLLLSANGQEPLPELFAKRPELAVKVAAAMLIAESGHDEMTPEMLAKRPELAQKAVELSKAVPKLFTMRFELAQESVKIAAGMQEMLEAHREEIAVLPVKQ